MNTPTKSKCDRTPTKATCDRTPTPRTDAKQKLKDIIGDEYVAVDFARQLERELTAALAEIDRLDVSGIHSCHANCQKSMCVMRRELTAVTKQRDEMTKYANKLAHGFPDGMLPKDVEVLREANLGLAVELTAVTEQRDRLMQVIESATILIAAKGRHNTMLAYNGLRDALQSLNQDHFPDVGNMIRTTTTEP